MASVRCSFVTGSLGLAKMSPEVWKGFWTLTLWLSLWLSFCLKTMQFAYNGAYYEKVFVTAMGSLVSAVIANMVMEDVEQRALATSPVKPFFWKRYVDDVISAVSGNEAERLLSHLNSVEPSIQFTLEREKDRHLSFLYLNVPRGVQGNLETSVYRKGNMFLMSYRQMAIQKPFSVTAENQVQLVALLMKGNQQLVLLLFLTFRVLRNPSREFWIATTLKLLKNLFRPWGIFSPNLRILSRKNNEPNRSLLLQRLDYPWWRH